MPVAAGIGAIAAPIIGGAIGNAAGAGDRDKAAAAQAAALQAIQGVQTPDIDQMRIALAKYQSAGQLTPELESAINQQASGMNAISVDPRLRNAQMQALQNLQQAGSGQLRPEDLAALNKIQNQTAQQNQAQQASILQNMQERGVGGGGAELAARLSASQNSANQAASGGLDIAGQASQRALQALASTGQLGQGMEQQQFGEAAQTAQAQDIINKYNAMNQQQVQGANVSAKNQAQAANLANAQSILNANTGLTNQQEQYNKGLYQQNFANQMQRAGAAANANNQAAQNYNNQAAQTGQMWSGIGSGVGQGAAAMGGYLQNQQNQQNQANYNNQYLNVLQGKPRNYDPNLNGPQQP